MPKMVMPISKSENPVKAWRKFNMSIMRTTMNSNHSTPVAIDKTKKNNKN